ncbi:hypothetical protein [Rickettsia felis]|uniref:hypothetical protein n=1 Tax=Rickettsia felis TaxID=42862 RepID=UPI000A6046F7|nr:hypothetical protein [Rickettsia felis]
MNYILHFSLTTAARLTNTIKTIGSQGYHMLKIGHNVASYYLTTPTLSLIEPTCHKENILTTLCNKGIELLNTETSNFVFEGMFKIKKVLTANKAIITAINDNGKTIRDYILQKQGDKTYIYEERLLKICQENLQGNPTIEDILNIAGDNNPIIGDIKGCEIFEVEKENALQAILSEIKDLIANPISSTTQAIDINTTERWTEYLSEMATNAVNNTITNSTAEISELIFSDNTESWTETGINLINNTVANLTNTAFNSTYNPQENMFDESDNDNSLATYIGIGIAVAASIVVAIGAGVTWYCVRSKKRKKKLN